METAIPSATTAPRAENEAADYRAHLVARGLCDAADPAVTVELYGSLRMRAGRPQVPLHAATIAAALAVLRRAHPQLARLLPRGDGAAPPGGARPSEACLPGDADSHRYSINGRTVTTDLSTPLVAGDHLILFSASVGG